MEVLAAIGGTALTFVLSSFMFALGHLITLRAFGKHGHFGKEVDGYYISLPATLKRHERHVTAFVGIVFGAVPLVVFVSYHPVGMVILPLYLFTCLIHLISLE